MLDFGGDDASPPVLHHADRVFDDYDAIIDAACDAWRKLLTKPGTITSIGMRDWAHVGHL